MVPELSNSGLPQPAIAELVGLYTSAADQLAAWVLQPPGGTEKARAWRQARAAQLAQQVKSLMQELNARTADWTGTNLETAIVDGVKRAEQQARDLGMEVPKDGGVGGSFALIDKGTVSVFARDMVGDLNGATASMGERATRLLHQTAQHDLSESDIDRILAGGVITGQPVETIRTLREELRKVAGNEITITDKNGDPMSFDVGYYASMVARTKTREATVTARHERLGGLGLDLVAVIGRVSVHFCTAYLGQVYSISGKSDKYPSLSELPSGGPPFHPNCSKSTRPFVEALASEQQIEQAGDTHDQENMLGIDASTAQKRFKDLQILAQVKKDYASTAKAKK